VAAPRDFIFGYGSLVTDGRVVPTRAFHRDGFVTDLHDVRRCWGVAMHNRVDLPGYKYYLDDHGDRPDVYVAFFDLRPAPGQSVNGVCLPVDHDQLAALDRRERNYVRRELTALCPLAGEDIRVWAYVGSPAGRRRLTTARAAGRAVIHRAYLAAVREGFERLGPGEYAACSPSLDPDGLPVLPLVRHDLASNTIEP
jgi:cation transport regulator ChaC